ncbi:MAG TPA: flagellar biosynthesis anti-sigma factor FlgM [Ktedonobacteraceae bacterium]|nr:flagellar biosynthesis anti-sigma factor FlgM [Ktedonobacteraceae bacterium]
MENEIVASHFHLNRADETAQFGQSLLENTAPSSEHNQYTHAEIQAIKRGVLAARYLSRSRSARVEKLRTQIEAGIYQINSTTLAESILKKEDHFSQAH